MTKYNEIFDLFENYTRLIFSDFDLDVEPNGTINEIVNDNGDFEYFESVEFVLCDKTTGKTIIRQIYYSSEYKYYEMQHDEMTNSLVTKKELCRLQTMQVLKASKEVEKYLKKKEVLCPSC